MPGGSSSRPAWSRRYPLCESYLARARQRLEQVQQTEEAAAEEALDRLDRKLEQTMRAVEASYEKNKERWVDTLFSLIVGVQP